MYRVKNMSFFWDLVQERHGAIFPEVRRHSKCPQPLPTCLQYMWPQPTRSLPMLALSLLCVGPCVFFACLNAEPLARDHHIFSTYQPQLISATCLTLHTGVFLCSPPTPFCPEQLPNSHYKHHIGMPCGGGAHVAVQFVPQCLFRSVRCGVAKLRVHNLSLLELLDEY